MERQKVGFQFVLPENIAKTNVSLQALSGFTT